MNKDDILQITITDISDDGSGIGRADNGCTLFVKDAVPGDVVRCKVMKAKRTYAYARLLEVVTPSADRVAPPCPIARPCGGCQIQAMSYEAQLRFKAGKVRGDLIRIGGFSADEVDGWMQPIVGMDEPWRYRNKAQFPVGSDREGNVVAGFYAGRTHAIVPCSDCLLGNGQNRTIMETVLAWMRAHAVTAYDEETGKGVLRHVLIRSGVYSGEVMVCIVANAQRLPDEEALVAALAALPGMTSICLNVNTRRTNVIMGDETRVLWGSEVITDTLHVPNTNRGVTFRISAKSFYQVNPRQTEKLYGIARSYADLTGKEILWDLYCGVGTISLFMADAAKEIFGVEIIPQAIEDARKNAVRNHVTNATYIVGKVEEVLPAYVQDGHHSVDVVVVDPPRKGCDRLTLDTILQVRPERIVYVSCDPATLARDLRILADGGYTIHAVTPVDQFPHTVHVETVVLLSKGEIDS